NFNVIPSNKGGLKPSTNLRGFYRQKKSKVGGYHKAEIYFKTKVPSLNLDQSGIAGIICDDNKITLRGNDVEKVNQWPDKVMLLISHKWKCFGKSTTQFVMVKDKIVDASNKKVTFSIERCNIQDWSQEFLLDVSWENGHPKKLNRRIDLPEINLANTLNLNVLFDEATGKTSNPDIPFADIADGKLLCTNCFMNGEATIALRVAGEFGITGIKLTDATITLDGNIKLNVDISLVVKAGIKSSITLASLPIISFGVPGLFNIGPSIDLVASTEISADVKAKVIFGGDISLPKFNAKVTFVNEPSFEQSGFIPEINLHKPILDIINDALFKQKVGLELVGQLNANITLGKQSKCRKGKQPRLESTVNGFVLPQRKAYEKRPTPRRKLSRVRQKLLTGNPKVLLSKPLLLALMTPEYDSPFKDKSFTNHILYKVVNEGRPN
ncbi:12353_t:CDS:2, partial [Funneliformis geosporum]